MAQDIKNQPNQYVQRGMQFNRPHRTGRTNSEPNNLEAFNKGVTASDNNIVYPYQPTPSMVNQMSRDASSLLNDGSSSAASMSNEQQMGTVNEDTIRKGMQILEKYKRGKQSLEDKIIRNEKWWKMRHWDMLSTEDMMDDPKPASGWLFNTIISKHADYMDSFPTSDILPREEGDVEEAKRLSSIIPVIMEQNEYKSVYSDEVWYKLKNGTGVYGVFWDTGKANGLGDILVQSMDLLSLFWQPGVTDIQKSENIFSVELVSNHVLENSYPQCQGKLSESQDKIVKKYWYDDRVDTTGKSAVIDWYYHKNVGGKNTLQYIKFVDDIVLYATENDTQVPTEMQNQPVLDENGQPMYDDYGVAITQQVEVPTGKSMAERGLYDHGLYPFVFDPLFPEAGMPVGFGFVDVCKNAQTSIDIYNNAFEKNVQFVCQPRYITRNDGGINEEEFKNPSNLLVHTDGNLGEDSFAPINTPAFINSNYITILDQKINEMKETAGNRDATTGGTQSGVTAASAIAAMQESAGKTSRDQISTTYEAHKKVVNLVIELIRQFYDMPRQFRIIGERGQQMFTQYTNAGLQPQYQGMEFGVDMGFRLPVFDIEVKAEKENAYTQMSQNELALQFYNQGFFNPQYCDQALACLDMMEFKGKQMVIDKIQANGDMYQQIIQLQQQMLQMAEVIDQMSGGTENMADTVAGAINERMGGLTAMPSGSASMPQSSTGSNIVENAKERAQSATAPR